MTTEQPKTTPEQPAAYPAHFLPPPPGYAPFLAYTPPTEGQQPEANGASPPPYPLMYPPGMVYAFPPPQGPAASPTATATPRPKRKQVKMACTNCAAASKRCDEGRPCERCKKYNIADSCRERQRKERQRGIKRGPYKRKNKQMPQTIESAYGEIPPGPEGSGSEPNASTAAAAIYAVAQFPPPPEGYYPVFLPPGYPVPEGQPGAEAAPVNGQPPPIMPFYIPGFPPFPYPPPPGTVFHFAPPGTQPPPSDSEPTVNADTEAEAKEDKEENGGEKTCVNPAELSDPGAHDKEEGEGERDSGSEAQG